MTLRWKSFGEIGPSCLDRHSSFGRDNNREWSYTCGLEALEGGDLLDAARVSPLGTFDRSTS